MTTLAASAVLINTGSLHQPVRPCPSEAVISEGRPLTCTVDSEAFASSSNSNRTISKMQSGDQHYHVPSAVWRYMQKKR